MAEYVVDLNGVETKKVVTDNDRLMALWGLPVRERIVRCRDCKFCMSYWGADYCDFFSHVTNDPDGFCAWGCRKETDE